MTPESAAGEPAGIYIHVPFCRSKCPYCDFYSLTDTAESAAYVDAVIDEIHTGRRNAPFTGGPLTGLKADTVYFGGGTPSFLGEAALGRLLKAVRSGYDISPQAEITVECNPSDASERLFSSLREAGFNRLSMGLQSAVDRERLRLGRRTGAGGLEEAVRAARESGFENISVDLMLGIPLQTPESLRDSLSFVVSLGVPHVSAYMLRIEEGTPFARLRSKLALADEDTVCDMYLAMCSILEEHGIEQYEISNFAVPGRESRHNLKYWRLAGYLGLGPAAHSLINGRRFYMERDLAGFIAGSPAAKEGPGGGPDEYLMLSLRLAEGFSYDTYRDRYAADIPLAFKAKAAGYADMGLARLNDRGFRLTPRGMLVSNTIIAELSEILLPEDR